MRRRTQCLNEILGVARDASLSAIRRAYRRLARRLHPDTGGPEGSLTFQDLQTASQGVATAQRALLAGRFALEGAIVSLEQTLAMPLDQIAALR